LLLTRKLLNKGFLLGKLKSSLRKIYGRHHDVVDRYGYKRPRICFICHKHFPVLSSFMTHHRVCNYINTTGATNGAATAYISGTPEFSLVFSGVRVTRSLILCVMFCRSLFALLYFFFWPLCCLFFFDLQILITHLLSSIFSSKTCNLNPIVFHIIRRV